MSNDKDKTKDKDKKPASGAPAAGGPPPPDLTKAAETPPEAQVTEGSTLSYPPPLKDHPDMKHKVNRWKEEGRIPCAHNRNRKGPQCYYPLNFVRTAKNNNQPEKFTLPNGEVAYRAECSWDPNHRGPDGEEQYITHAERFPEAKKDE